MKKLKFLLQLFFSMMKVSAFTFGGGYAMIHLLDNEFVDRKKWIDGEEFMDLVAIAESTPGPIAINCATYIGYRKAGVLGAIVATIGMSLPSFVIIYLISLFFDQFLSIAWVAAAFKGIGVCVVFLIFSAGIKMLKKIKKTAFNLSVVGITFGCMVMFTLFSVRFSTIFYIIIFGSIGLLTYSVKYIAGKQNAEKEEKQ